MDMKRFLLSIVLLYMTLMGAGCMIVSPSHQEPMVSKTPISTLATPTAELLNYGNRNAPEIAGTKTESEPVQVIEKTPTVLLNRDIHHVIEDSTISQLTIDDQFVYWTRHNDNKLYRIPLNGDRKEVLATSHYPSGQFSVMPFVRTGKWLIVMDTPMGKEEGRTWQIRVIDLEDGSERVLIESERDPASWPGPEIRGDNNRIVVTYNHSSAQKQCTENTFAVIDLQTDEVLKLDEGCAENRYLWVFAGISGPYVVADRYLPDYKGKTSDIFLFNLNTKERTQLTQDGQSSMPDVSGRWIAWKASPRFTFGQTMLYDIETGSRFLIDLPDIPGLPGYRAPRLASGRWLYWRVTKSGEPVFVFDLNKQSLLEIAPASNTEDIRNRTIDGNVMAWVRVRLHTLSDSVIEWTELPP